MATLKMVAILKDEDGNPLPGKTINFYVNGNLVGSQTTDSSGQAVYDYQVRSGTYTVKAEFPGDDKYEPSEASVTVTVGAVPTETKAIPTALLLGGLIVLLFILGSKRRE